MSSRDHIYKLIAQGEHQELDFKYEMNDSRKIARSLVAFANTDGGRLLVGVKDNGKIVGVNSEEEMYMVEAAAQVFSTPEITITGKLHEVEGKDVLEIIIKKSQEKHNVKEEDGKQLAYIRKEDKNLKAPPVLRRIWSLEKEKNGRRFTYGPNEEKLFAFLRENESISFKKYCRLTRQHYKRATDRLARLVKWGVLDMTIDEKSIRYSANPDHEMKIHEMELHEKKNL